MAASVDVLGLVGRAPLLLAVFLLYYFGAAGAVRCFVWRDARGLLGFRRDVLDVKLPEVEIPRVGMSL